MPETKVTVTACTYQRPDGLENLLEGISRQTAVSNAKIQVSILIVDNEGSATSRQICTSFRARHPAIALQYVVELRRGISHARNKVLDHVGKDCDFIAMIDDDEIPAETWLEKLLEQQQRTGAQIVRGPIVPVFEDAIPQWLEKLEYFGWPRSDSGICHGQQLDFASTNNTLVSWPAISQLNLRFNPALAFTGGEDSVFFKQMHLAGNRIVFTDQAVVHETIPASRSDLPALLRMSYHLGINRLKKQHYLDDAENRPDRLSVKVIKQLGKSLGAIATGMVKLLLCSLTGRWSAACFFPALMKISRGAGLFAGLFGIRYRYYR